MTLKKSHIISMIVVLVIGTLWHYVYEWFGFNPVLGAVAPVNESTWEHLKLLFTPFFIATIVEYFLYGKNYPSFIPARAIGAVVGIVTITALFYTYTGIVGDNFFVVDILTFVVAVILAYMLSYGITQKDAIGSTRANVIGWAVLFLMLALFVIFTFDPPRIPLFQDPTNGSFGI